MSGRWRKPAGGTKIFRPPHLQIIFCSLFPVPRSPFPPTQKREALLRTSRFLIWWREADLNHRPSGYEPDELPGCSIPRRCFHYNRKIRQWGQR